MVVDADPTTLLLFGNKSVNIQVPRNTMFRMDDAQTNRRQSHHQPYALATAIS
jgi:hypothetical protein